MSLIENFNYYFYDNADPRVRDMFIISSIWFPIITLIIYLYISFKVVVNYMKNRPAYKLNTFIKIYNIFQVITNAYIVYELASCYPFLRILECRLITYDLDECSMRILNASVLTLYLKFIDLSETVIYLLRKKNSQVSVLHLYHHISTFLVGVIFLRYFTSEVTMLFPLMNCAVHVIMYFYYFLSNFEGPIKQLIKPFKPYLTLIQMGQFVIMLMQIIIYSIQNCGISKVLLVTMFINVSFNFGLFFNFYQKNYINSKKKKN
ncbi:elongation of very long chain fatty acids protein F-like [Leptopilina boulardi]|uniref:elongation of very long chain fatty acids protein F-like n=1 Tax=Leptopilina boulardi TaxID=63433 RepID=UPI0021F5FE4D|nr:elongation of very long chain fatty acids protein F-like [Leptopilina boulardi]